MNRNTRGLGLNLIASVSSIFLALALASLILIINGNNPIAAYMDMVEYGTRLESFALMLNRATPLYLSAIAVAIGFRMNLFNIGVEGQYILAALIAAEVGAEVSLPAPIHVLFIVVVAMAVGSIWAAIPGILKATRGIHEVISTIMLNAIGVSFLVAFLLNRWRTTDAASTDLNIQTDTIPKSGRLPDVGGFLDWIFRDTGTELNGAIIIAICVGVFYWIYVYRTRPGYELRASGMNPLAAEAAGVSPSKTIITTMLLSGAVAGLVGLAQILGPNHGSYNYDLEFTQMLGFNGIAVALLGQNHPGGIALSAIFFSYLDTTGPILDITDTASSEIVTIMKGVIIFVMVIAFEYTRRLREADEARRSSAALTSSVPPVSNSNTPEDRK